jgi:hypothetical protein
LFLTSAFHNNNPYNFFFQFILMSLELELKKTSQGKEVYVWHPKVGKKYSMGMHGQGIFGTMKEGIYFGTMEGNFIFFNKEGQKLVSYQCPIGSLAMWYGDCEEGPLFTLFSNYQKRMSASQNS